MKNLIPYYIEYLYKEYDFINFNAPRNIGKSRSFCKSIINDLLVERKVANIFNISEKHSIQFLFDACLNDSEKEIITKRKNYILFKNGSIVFFNNLKNLFKAKKADIYYFDSIYDSLKIEILNYMDLDSKIIFNDCLFNGNIIKKVNEISNKKFQDINIEESNDIVFLLRRQKIKKIQDQLSCF